MKKILIIDDDSNNRLLLNLIFEKEGFKVIEAKNGKEGINIAIAEKPNVILMDIMMPEINGIHATKILKSKKETKNIPVVILTALGEDFEDKEIADELITKPIDTKKLISVVKKLL